MNVRKLSFRTKLGIGLGVLALMVLIQMIWIKTQKSQIQDLGEKPAQGSRSVAAVKAAATSPEKALNKEASASQQISALESSPVEQKRDLGMSNEIRVAIQQFRALKAKVFMSDAERARRRALIENRNLLRELGEWLRKPVAVDLVDSAGNVAVDLLLEALSGKEADVAREAMASIISDKQIENYGELQPADRQLLAGRKAEVMYNWSSMDRGAESRIQQMLPGPVSVALWKNVIQAQERNLAESQKEMPR